MKTDQRIESGLIEIARLVQAFPVAAQAVVTEKLLAKLFQQNDMVRVFYEPKEESPTEPRETVEDALKKLPRPPGFKEPQV